MQRIWYFNICIRNILDIIHFIILNIKNHLNNIESYDISSIRY